MQKENILVKYTMTYGLYLGLAFSLVIYVFHLGGKVHFLGDEMGIFNAMILTFGIYFFGRKYRNSYVEGIFLYRQALGFSVLLSVFSAIIYSFFSYWYYSIIEPHGIGLFIDQIKIVYSESDKFTADQLEAMVQLYRSTLTPGAMAFTVFLSHVFMGTLFGLVVSVFIKTPININRDNF